MNQVRHGQYERAEQTLKRIGGKNKADVLVDLMDRAMVLHRQGQYARSNEYLEMADTKIDEFYTKKFSDALKALAWNDTSATYQGEDFERTMVDILQAFNYLGLGQFQEALVEARQVNRKLGVFTDKLKALKVRTGYTSDPFANYITGLIHEGAGDHDRAYLSLKSAHTDYESLGVAYGVSVPAALAGDLARTARGAGRLEDAQRWAAASQSDAATVKGGGEIVVVVGLGLVAHKESRKWGVIHEEDSVIVTYPEFALTPTRVAGAAVSIDAAAWSSVQVVHDLTTIATGVMKERNDSVKARAVAAAILRFITRKAATAIAEANSGHAGIQLAASLFNTISKVKEVVETADTRSWQLLPDRYAMARFPVAAGTHQVVVRFTDQSGREVRREAREVRVGENTKAFVIAHSADSPVVAPARPKSRRR